MLEKPKLIFPAYDIKTRETEDGEYLFDVVRGKYLAYQPEEWVRQHLVHFLIKERAYPKTLMTIETGLTVNDNAARTDLVVYDKDGKVFLLAECKSPKVKLTQTVFDQANSYNYQLKSKYYLITNGLQLFCLKMHYESNGFEYLRDVPYFTR